jgi:hypothetical protein
MTKKAILCVSVTMRYGGQLGRGIPSPGYERAKLQVLKVFSARDGDAISGNIWSAGRSGGS